MMGSDEVSEETLRVFERAFSDGGRSCVLQCDCGHTFFNSEGGWDWNEGELDELAKWAKNGKATDLPWAPGYVVFEGRRFVTDCGCWKARANKVICWLMHHRFGIVEFFNLEKARRIKAEATAMPDVTTV